MGPLSSPSPAGTLQGEGRITLSEAKPVDHPPAGEGKAPAACNRLENPYKAGFRSIPAGS